MPLSTDDIKKVASLARLAMTEPEIQAAHAQLTGIFGLIAEMQAVNTENVEPMSHSQDVTQRLRDDTVTEADRRADFQAIAPQVEQGLYLVPRVIE